jgi:hypothetical protein
LSSFSAYAFSLYRHIYGTDQPIRDSDEEKRTPCIMKHFATPSNRYILVLLFILTTIVDESLAFPLPPSPIRRRTTTPSRRRTRNLASTPSSRHQLCTSSQNAVINGNTDESVFLVEPSVPSVPQNRLDADHSGTTANNALEAKTPIKDQKSVADEGEEEDWGNELLVFDNIFDIVAGRAATCLVESDLRRDAKEGYSKIISSSATNWINDATAFKLQKAFDRIKLKVNE